MTHQTNHRPAQIGSTDNLPRETASRKWQHFQELVENGGIEPHSQRHRFYRPPQVPACCSLSIVWSESQDSNLVYDRPRIAGLPLPYTQLEVGAPRKSRTLHRAFEAPGPKSVGGGKRIWETDLTALWHAAMNHYFAVVPQNWKICWWSRGRPPGPLDIHATIVLAISTTVAQGGVVTVDLLRKGTRVQLLSRVIATTGAFTVLLVFHNLSPVG